MRLWLLRPHPAVISGPRGANPWEPWYDKSFGFVVRAETEAEARAVADDKSGDESNRTFGGPPSYEITSTVRPWLDPSLSTCEELTAEGEPGLVIQDFNAA